ncbi:MAG: hypothetical protein IKX49_02980, partial [Clostridia bacterium]|nr:hypothetical protein [Clostridia bacterium]
GEDGVLVVSVCADIARGSVYGDVQIYAKGFIYSEDGNFDELKAVAVRSVERAISKGSTEIENLKARLREEMASVISQKTRRKPVIIPIITEAEQ